MGLPFIIGVIVVVAIVMGIAGIYNNLVTLRNRVDNAWQNIDTQLQRRNDLIPNLVETVKGYAAHEQETLDAVTQARTAATTAATPEEKMAADNALTGALRQLLMEKKVRRAGGRTQGPAAFTDDDRERFQRNLAQLLREALDS